MPARFVCPQSLKRLDRARGQGANGKPNYPKYNQSVFGVAFFFVSGVCAIAGSAASGGPQIAPTDNAPVSTYKATDTSVGASARDSAGASTSQAGAPSSATSSNASSTDASASNGPASSNGNASSGYG